MEKKMLLIYNPVSGRTQIKDALADITETFTKDNYRVTIHPTQRKHDCFEYLKKCAECYDVICVCGGDGILNEALNAFMLMPEAERPPIAYIPAGSTNDFAASVGISGDPKTCAEKIVKGKPFFCDAGCFGNKHFAYIAAFGAFTSVAYDTSQDLKNIFGHFAYIVEGIRCLPSIRANHMKITYGDNVIEGDFIYGMITNALQVGGILRNNSSTEISLNDGLFEVLLVRETKNAMDVQAILSGVITQNLSSDPFIFFRASEMTFESDTPISWTLDGEYGGEISKVQIKNIKRAFSVIV